MSVLLLQKKNCPHYYFCISKIRLNHNLHIPQIRLPAIIGANTLFAVCIWAFSGHSFYMNVVPTVLRITHTPFKKVRVRLKMSVESTLIH